LGIGDWGLGPIPNPQSPIPNVNKNNNDNFTHKNNLNKINNNNFCKNNKLNNIKVCSKRIKRKSSLDDELKIQPVNLCHNLDIGKKTYENYLSDDDIDVYDINKLNSENVKFDKNDILFNCKFEDKTENIKMENKICINDIITESNKCNNNGNLVENDIVNNLNIGLPILFLFQFFIYFFPLFTFPFSLFFFF